MSLKKVNPRHMELAKQVLSHARSKGWAPGHHLTEVSLVEAFGVSRSPVRSALRLLAEKGILKFERNRGYFLACTEEDLGHLHLEVPLTDVESVYLRLVEDRIEGGLAKEVHQKDLLERYKVNRYLLLRAVERMENEGLLARNRARGWSFLPVIEDLRSEEASYDFRLMVEPSSIALSGFSVDYEALTRMRHSHVDLRRNVGSRRLIPSQVFEVDADFHKTIADFSGNSFVIQAIQHHNRLRRMVEYHGYGDGRRVETWIGEHLRIVDALERRRFESAAGLMAVHLRNGRAYAKRKA